MTTTTLDPTRTAADDVFSRQIAALARQFARHPEAHWARLVELFAALLAAGVAVDTLYCALEKAIEENITALESLVDELVTELNR